MKKANLKFCCVSDLHLTVKTPLCRKDNFLETQFRKLDFIFKTTEKEGGLLFIAGDVFDRPIEPYSLVSRFIELKNKYKIKVFVIAGQHDMHFHNPDLSNTPLGILIKSRVIYYLEREEIQGKIFCGCSFGCEYKNGDILITHEMIVKNNPLFQGQTNFKFAEKILKNNKYKIVISGDNHKKFTAKYKKDNISDNSSKLLINCGSVIRSKSDQKNHIPSMFIVEWGKLVVFNSIEIPIEEDVFKSEDVLNISEISIDVKEQILELANKMQNNNTKTLKFKKIIDDVLGKYNMKDKEEVKNKIRDIFN